MFLTCVCLLPASLGAQDEHNHAVAAPATTQWTWTTDANVIAGYNYQGRKFADFWAWESQNWVMLSGEHALGPGRLTLHGMLSLDPFTLGQLVFAKGLDTNGNSPRSASLQAGRRRRSRPARAISARRSSTINIPTIC